MCPSERLLWRPYKLGDEIHNEYEYRRVEKQCVTTQREIFELDLLKSYETSIFIGSKENYEQYFKEEYTKKTWLEENYRKGIGLRMAQMLIRFMQIRLKKSVKRF